MANHYDKKKDRIGKKYLLKKRLGSGAFGEVYLAQDIVTKEELAAKLEKVSARHPQLLYESKVYKVLQGDGIAELKWYGQEAKYNVLITERLGRSLEDHFTAFDRAFQTPTQLIIAKQMLERIEYMHDKYFVHRDIKPDNFMSGFGPKAAKIYVIDFGLSKRFRNPRTKKHIPYKEGKSLVGTPRYASINNHLGVEQSRRDDMESLGYVVVYLARGSLPWQGIQAGNKRQKYQKIMDRKMAVPITRLCDGINPAFRQYLDVVRSMRYEDKPDYETLKGFFIDALKTVCGEEWFKVKPEWCTGEEIDINPPSINISTEGQIEPEIEDDVTPPYNHNTSGVSFMAQAKQLFQRSSTTLGLVDDM